MQIGIIGLPNVGKSTLFNAITKAGAPVAAYPFTTVEPNVGIAEVPDERLQAVAAIVHPEKVVPATIRFLDVAGLVKGASKGEGLGNQFLSHIRAADAIAHVVRCFEDKNIAHVSGQVQPASDIEIVNVELALADLTVAEKAMRHTEQNARTNPRYRERFDTLSRIKESLERGLPVRSLNLDSDTKKQISDLSFLTLKPIVYVANISEKDSPSLDNPFVKQVFSLAQAEGTEAIAICAKLESEIAELEGEEAKTFLTELGLTESGLEKFIHASYKLLDLVTFFTIESQEARAWSIPHGTKANEAAGKIHSDMERGFIKAEVVSCQDLIKAGSFHQAREDGHLKIEGKEYLVQEGDVIYFKFAV